MDKRDFTMLILGWILLGWPTAWFWRHREYIGGMLFRLFAAVSMATTAIAILIGAAALMRGWRP